MAIANSDYSAFALVGGGLNFVTPVGRPFSLLDLSISYPVVQESISTTTLMLAALIGPAIIITVVALLLTPGPSVRRAMPRRDVVRRSLWELQAGLAGLALAIAVSFFITQGLKNLFGRPRPHLLALCRPDMSNIADHVVGGLGQDISRRWTLVSKSICTLPSARALNDGFRSFPSGHASMSWSGLLYLSLFLASKFAVTIPYLPADSGCQTHTMQPQDTEMLPLHNAPSTQNSDAQRKTSPQSTIRPKLQPPLYNLAATPPNHLLILVLIPIATAAYITSTRFSEFQHHGFDIFFGAVLGSASAWGSFRWYHLPIRRGQGWAWGPRSKHRAFGVGVGTYGGYLDREGWNYGSAETGNTREDECSRV